MAAIDGAQDRLAVPESAQGGAAHDRQYGLSYIIGLWAVAALPMALLAWVITPALIPRIKLPPALLFWLMMIAGMVWQLAVSL